MHIYSIRIITTRLQNMHLLYASTNCSLIEMLFCNCFFAVRRNMNMLNLDVESRTLLTPIAISSRTICLSLLHISILLASETPLPWIHRSPDKMPNHHRHWRPISLLTSTIASFPSPAPLCVYIFHKMDELWRKWRKWMKGSGGRKIEIGCQQRNQINSEPRLATYKTQMNR